MVRIGITGGIGTGKSTVCRILKCMQIPVYEADAKARELMESQPDLIRSIRELFGSEAYLDNHLLNRAHLAETVFKAPTQLEKLNRLVHPAVHDDFRKWCQRHETKHAVVAKEAALMLEEGKPDDLDYVLAVVCPDEKRIERIMKRDPHRSHSQIRNIICRQLPQNKMQQLADFTVVNDDAQPVIEPLLDILKKI
ncbi:MAG: dephospho-CoA kinase [Cytophagales bacterium]|nr:dephospho-CoA kinase [Cytophagales bacterium]